MIHCELGELEKTTINQTADAQKKAVEEHIKALNADVKSLGILLGCEKKRLICSSQRGCTIASIFSSCCGRCRALGGSVKDEMVEKGVTSVKCPHCGAGPSAWHCGSCRQAGQGSFSVTVAPVAPVWSGGTTSCSVLAE
mmetsp:Transcript_1649/g.4523  ORF Transcript_1649/g.4523 Transcript_1649/m.4523 type:complete len:139 (+) Transcript_1649:477-893(+)